MKRLSIICILLVVAFAPVFGSGAQEGGAETGGVLNTGSDYPIVNEPIEVSAAVGRYADGTSPEEKWFWRYMENLTGISVDVQQLTPQNMQEQLNLMFATGELPDFLLHVSLGNSQVSRYGAQGFFQPLGDLIDEHAPNIAAAFEENPLAKASVTAPDGKIYMLPGIFVDRESFATQRPLLNNYWLANLGLEPPETLDEFTAMLRAFKAQDANGNGDPNDEIPFGGAWGEGYDERMPILTALGIVTNGGLVGYNQGEVSFVPYDPLFEEYLRIMNTYWEEGLLDQDLFTQTDAQARSKYAEGTVGYVLDGAGFVFSETNWLEYEAASPVTSDWNDTPVWPEFAPMQLSRFFMSSQTEHPEALIRWANWFFTTENSVTFWGGPLQGSEEAEMGGMTDYGRRWDATNRIVYDLPPDVDSAWQYIYRKASPVFGYNLGFVFGAGGNEKGWYFQEAYGREPLAVAPGSFTTYIAEEPNLGIFSTLSRSDVSRLRAMYENTGTMYELREGVSADDQAWAFGVLEGAGWVWKGDFKSKDRYWRVSFLQRVTPHFAMIYPNVFFTPEEVERLDELTTPLEDFVEQMEARFITGVEPLSNFDEYLEDLRSLGAEEYLRIHQDAEARFRAATE